MQTQRLHRGRLIDHLHLVVRDLAAGRRFRGAAADELFGRRSAASTRVDF